MKRKAAAPKLVSIEIYEGDDVVSFHLMSEAEYYAKGVLKREIIEALIAGKSVVIEPYVEE